ncbi:MAG: ribosome biogenesis GTPase Der [Oscillospiraceae bacterium]|nr:ribosome biogenesis GTPase Der [Oscillospiraceae bacterium]
MLMPLIAIVGRPNVGKSTLFNRLIGQRKAIVEGTPGVTRDRNYGKCEWRGRNILVVDTGGLEPYSNDEILMQMWHQINVAIEQANVIVFVTDLKAGVTSADLEIAEILQKTNKPILVAVNKCDSLGATDPSFYEFYNLGLSNLIEISAAHGHGVGDLLDAAFEKIEFGVESTEEENNTLKVAVVGKPNVGKSSLINAITKEERLIVSSIAGTTRDSIDTLVKNSHGSFIFVDTAGIRKKSKVEEDVEYYSVVRAFRAIEGADVCIVMLDAETGFTEQDSKIAGFAHQNGKATIIVVNKWDKIEKDTGTLENYKKELKASFAFMSYAPIIFISVKTGQRIDKLFEEINFVAQQNNTRLTTSALNVMLAEATARVQPPTDKGKRLKVYYITQIATKPPTFVIFTNSLELFHFSYKRYLENQIRTTFGLNATPIKIILRERREKRR